ncbi:MAG: hypothetical protein ACOCSQ_03415 [Planctomycetota bacterium]
MAQHYFYDVRTGGFFPDQYPQKIGPTQLYYYDSESPLSGVLWGGVDGYIRKMEETSPNDDGEILNSEVTLGPVRATGDQIRDGILTKLVVVLAYFTGEVTYEIKAGESANQCLSSSPVRTGVWSGPGMSLVHRPRVHAPSFALRLKGEVPWAMELIKVQTIAAGTQK